MSNMEPVSLSSTSNEKTNLDYSDLILMIYIWLLKTCVFFLNNGCLKYYLDFLFFTNENNLLLKNYKFDKLNQISTIYTKS